MSRYAGRSTRRFKAQRTAFRNDCATRELPCWLCGNTIDYTLPKEHPEAFNLDHGIPVATRPDLAEEPANFRPSHKTCNEARGTSDPHIQLGQPSEPW